MNRYEWDSRDENPQASSPVEGGVKNAVALLEGRDEEGDDKEEKAQEPRTTEREEEERSSDLQDRRGHGGRSSNRGEAGLFAMENFGLTDGLGGQQVGTAETAMDSRRPAHSSTHLGSPFAFT